MTPLYTPLLRLIHPGTAMKEISERLTGNEPQSDRHHTLFATCALALEEKGRPFWSPGYPGRRTIAGTGNAAPQDDPPAAAKARSSM